MANPAIRPAHMQISIAASKRNDFLSYHCPVRETCRQQDIEPYRHSGNQ